MMEMYSNSKTSVTNARMGANVVCTTDFSIVNCSYDEDYLGAFA